MNATNGHALASPMRPVYAHDLSHIENPEHPTRLTADQMREIVSELEIPFDPSVVTWRTTNMSKDKSRGQVIPYADQRAYTDRLNQLLTPGGWTRKYKVDTTGNLERGKDQKVVAKIVVTCELTVFGLGTHSATGEEWADDENAATSAEAQAFKRAASCFGLGRYLYYFTGVWVDLDHRKRPKSAPVLFNWATPEGWRKGQRPTAVLDAGSQRDQVLGNGHSQTMVREIEAMAEPLGRGLYRGLLRDVARVWNPSEIQDISVREQVLEHMHAADRGLRRLEAALNNVGSERLISILKTMGLSSLARVDTLESLKRIVNELERQP